MNTYYEKNREAIRKKQAEYYAANKEKVRAKVREYVAANKEKKRASDKAYYEANKEKVRANVKEYTRANRESVLAYKKGYREANKEKIARQKLDWKRRNPEVVTANTARRKAALLKATPAWANDHAIKFFYATRRWISEETQSEWHVDHVVPLQGKTVTGLHVHNNLRVVPAEVNLRKGNHHE